MEASPIVVSCFTSPASYINTLLLEHVFYIYDLVHLQKDWAEMQTLIDFKNKINTMTLTYAFKPGLKV